MLNKVCPQCQTINDPEYHYCKKCGRDISNIQPYDTDAVSKVAPQAAWDVMTAAGKTITGVEPEQKYAHARARIRAWRNGAAVLRIFGWLFAIGVGGGGITLGTVAHDASDIGIASIIVGLVVALIIIFITENNYSLKMMQCDLLESNLDIEENTRHSLEVLRFLSKKDEKKNAAK